MATRTRTKPKVYLTKQEKERVRSVLSEQIQKSKKPQIAPPPSYLRTQPTARRRISPTPAPPPTPNTSKPRERRRTSTKRKDEPIRNLPEPKLVVEDETFDLFKCCLPLLHIFDSKYLPIRNYDKKAKSYFDPYFYSATSHPDGPRRKSGPFRPSTSEEEYFVFEDLAFRKSSLEIALGNGNGVRFRIYESGVGEPNYICRCFSTKVFGNPFRASRIRDVVIKYVQENWEELAEVLINAYSAEVVYFQNYDNMHADENYHKFARFMYTCIHHDHFFEIKLFELYILCNHYKFNLTLIVNTEEGRFEILAPKTSHEEHVFIIARESRDWQFNRVYNYGLIWLEYIPSYMKRLRDPKDCYMPNCKLILTYINPPINYFHFLEYENFKETRRVIKDCVKTGKFPRIPKKLRLGRIRAKPPKPITAKMKRAKYISEQFHPVSKTKNKKMGKLRTGRVYFARRRRVMVYWRPSRVDPSVYFRNLFLQIRKCLRRFRDRFRKKMKKKLPDDFDLSQFLIVHDDFAHNREHLLPILRKKLAERRKRKAKSLYDLTVLKELGKRAVLKDSLRKIDKGELDVD